MQVGAGNESNGEVVDQATTKNRADGMKANDDDDDDEDIINELMQAMDESEEGEATPEVAGRSQATKAALLNELVDTQQKDSASKIDDEAASKVTAIVAGESAHSAIISDSIEKSSLVMPPIAVGNRVPLLSAVDEGENNTHPTHVFVDTATKEPMAVNGSTATSDTADVQAINGHDHQAAVHTATITESSDAIISKEQLAPHDSTVSGIPSAIITTEPSPTSLAKRHCTDKVSVVQLDSASINLSTDVHSSPPSSRLYCAPSTTQVKPALGPNISSSYPDAPAHKDKGMFFASLPNDTYFCEASARSQTSKVTRENDPEKTVGRSVPVPQTSMVTSIAAQHLNRVLCAGKNETHQRGNEEILRTAIFEVALGILFPHMLLPHLTVTLHPNSPLSEVRMIVSALPVRLMMVYDCLEGLVNREQPTFHGSVFMEWLSLWQPLIFLFLFLFLSLPSTCVLLIQPKCFRTCVRVENYRPGCRFFVQLACRSCGLG